MQKTGVIKPILKHLRKTPRIRERSAATAAKNRRLTAKDLNRLDVSLESIVEKAFLRRPPLAECWRWSSALYLGRLRGDVCIRLRTDRMLAEKGGDWLWAVGCDAGLKKVEEL